MQNLLLEMQISLSQEAAWGGWWKPLCHKPRSSNGNKIAEAKNVVSGFVAQLGASMSWERLGSHLPFVHPECRHDL